MVAKLVEEADIPTEDIDLLRRCPEEFSQWKAQNGWTGTEADIPEKRVTSTDRRKERIAEQFADGPKKEYADREKVFGQPGALSTLLYDSGNSTPTITAKWCVKSARRKCLFHKEHEAQFFALCPLRAVMYKALIKKDEAVVTDLREALLNMDTLEASLRLGDLDATIQFVEPHLCDTKTILEEIGRGED